MINRDSPVAQGRAASRFPIQTAVVIVLAAAAVIAGLTACSPKPTPPAPGGGGTEPPPLPQQFTLSVFTDPPGASVQVDGRTVGTTPIAAIELTNDTHRVTITAQGSSLTETLSQSTATSRVIYVEMSTGVKALAPYEVTSTRPETDVFLAGMYLGKAPLLLYLGLEPYAVRRLTAHAPGTKPGLQVLFGDDEPPPSPRAVAFALETADQAAGRVQTPPGVTLPTLSWLDASHGRISGEIGCASIGPDGWVAVTGWHGSVETIFAIDARPGREAVPPRMLSSWRTKDLVTGESPWSDQGLVAVGWWGSRFYFLVPETPPGGGSPGRLGMALYETDVADASLHRLDWWPHWSVGTMLDRAWLTADGKAVVILTIGTGGPGFRVVDTASGEVRLLNVRVPLYEGSACTGAQVSPDGRSAAWTGVAWGVGTGTVTVLDLRTGGQRVVLNAPDEKVGGVWWSPDSRMLAVARARSDEKHCVSGPDDSPHLYPARYTIVTAAGEPVTEVEVEGDALGPVLTWGPGSDRIAVISVSVEPAPEPHDPHYTEETWTKGVYAGTLDGELELVWQNAAQGPDRVQYTTLGFLPDGRVVMGHGTPDNRRTLVTADVAGRTGEGKLATYDGFYPVDINDRASWSPASSAREAGVLAYSGGGGLYLVITGGQTRNLIAAQGGSYPSVWQWEGDYLLVRQAGYHVFRLGPTT